MLPATCPIIMTKDQRYSWLDSSVTVSAENVEKVVRLPRNPVAIANRAASGIQVWPLVIPINTPIRNPPMRFAANVPKGIVGKTELKVKDSHHRNKAPKTAAILIDKMDTMLATQEPVLGITFSIKF